MILGIPYVVFWLILVAIFFVVEFASPALVSVWFALGALVATLASLVGASFGVQLVIFIVVSALAVAIMWRFRDRIWIAKKYKQATNSDRVLGEKAVVIESIDSVEGKGLVKVKGIVWSAVSDENQSIAKGEYVWVKEIRGVKLLVSSSTTK